MCVRHRIHTSARSLQSARMFPCCLSHNTAWISSDASTCFILSRWKRLYGSKNEERSTSYPPWIFGLFPSPLRPDRPGHSSPSHFAGARAHSHGHRLSPKEAVGEQTRATERRAQKRFCCMPANAPTQTPLLRHRHCPLLHSAPPP